MPVMSCLSKSRLFPLYREDDEEVSQLMSKLCAAAESACQDLINHMQREELKVQHFLSVLFSCIIRKSCQIFQC